MCRNKENPCGDDEFAAWDGQEKDLSASLTVRWSQKRKRWESDNAFFGMTKRTSGAAAAMTASIITAFAAYALCSKAMWAEFYAREPIVTA